MHLYNRLLLIDLLIFTFIIRIGAQELPAFPNAEGWAANTPGGRGGQIIRVTNLNANGSGSFNAAVTTSGPRIVVFEVGGVIDLEGNRITINEPFLTVAGQTAPSPGITFIDGSILIRETYDIIIQHIRVRPGAARHSVGWEPDGISLTSAYNVILDHCSVSWAVDENISASGPRFEGDLPDDWRNNTSHTTTFSNNIIAEGLSNATHSKGEHSKGSLIHDNATEIAVIKNLYTSNVQRNPYFKGGARGVVLNNYIYNPGSVAVHYNLSNSEWEGHPHETGKMTVIGNVLQYGPDTGHPALIHVGNGPANIYLEDNIAKDGSGTDVSIYDGDVSKLVDSSPVWNDNLQLIPADTVRYYIIANAGARPWDRDEIDIRIINDLLTDNGQIIDFETEVGGYPLHQATHAPFNEEEWDLRYMIKISPTVKITNPRDGDQFLRDSTINVTADASDYDGNISYVELFIDGLSEGQDTFSPYQWQISRSLVDNYALVAVAKDDSNLTSVPDTVFISIVDTIKYRLDLNIDGQGSIEQNPKGTLFPEGTTMTLTAVPLENYEFAEWSGDLRSGANPVTLHMEDNKIINANFIATVQSSLDIHYSFEGTTSSFVDDQSGNSRYAFLTNMYPITVVTGPFGDALQFDGVDDCMLIPPLDYTAHGFSLSFWIRQEFDTVSAPWLNYMDGYNRGFAINYDTTGVVRFEINDGEIASFVEAPGDVFVTGEWEFVTALVKRDPDQLLLYTDGTLIASSIDSTRSISNAAKSINFATDALRTIFFKGTIDELRIYNYALSETEIQVLFSTNASSIDRSNLPIQYALAARNYPNPFNAVTNIEYSIPKKSPVELNVYNLIGQEVASLIGEDKPAGRYRVAFNTTNLSSGIYLLRLRSGNNTIVKKMVLLK